MKIIIENIALGSSDKKIKLNILTKVHLLRLIRLILIQIILKRKKNFYMVRKYQNITKNSKLNKLRWIII